MIMQKLELAMGLRQRDNAENSTAKRSGETADQCKP